MREPVNRTILLLDIERFSRRDDVVQVALRRTLNAVVDRTLVAAGVEATQQYREDRGDGLIVLISGDVAKTAVLRSLLGVTPELVHDYNRLASGSAQMRLRIVLASGEVAHDPQGGTTGGLVGHDLNQAFRLLDSDTLRDTLARREAEGCVLAVSAPVYEGIVRHGHQGVRPELFRRSEVAVKDGTLSAWLHNGCTADTRATEGRPSASSDGTAPSGGGEPAGTRDPEGPAELATARPPAQERRGGGAVFHFHGSPVVHGSLVGGDQHGVSGGQVSGGVVLGGSATGSVPLPASAADEGTTDDGGRR
ncbi:hypothetical protein [Streptomyces nitrosporeus]|uniref:hypothetical protein n=1 Tax=Streptomyces nitrosporeus TaxID=28894 RepID=UPI0019CC1162|nr:hypothetical protein [Streptomyces nitrosporeus]GGY94777.1 hypothetical protein GCM10010327_26820 [Streptomyces nitrosporeus]